MNDQRERLKECCKEGGRGTSGREFGDGGRVLVVGGPDCNYSVTGAVAAKADVGSNGSCQASKQFEFAAQPVQSQ